MSNIASPEIERHRFLYVGMDIHKDNHAAIATNCFGQNLLEMKVKNSKKDFDNFAAMVERLSKQNNLVPLLGLEDSCGYGQRLAGYLYKNGYSVKTVPPILVDKARYRETHPEKNDSLDALQVARVLIQRIDRLPNYSLSEDDEVSKQIKELTLDREFLIKEQTRIKTSSIGFCINHTIQNTKINSKMFFHLKLLNTGKPIHCQGKQTTLSEILQSSKIKLKERLRDYWISETKPRKLNRKYLF